MTRTAAALGLLLALAGAHPALAASGADTFTMPSRNIYCAYEHYSFAPKGLRCEIRSGVEPLPPKPKWCDVDWGAGYSLSPIGTAHVLCVGDTVYDPKAKLLAYGRTWRGGGFTCEAKRAGLRCVNARGHGFFLSRERSYTFTETAAQQGSFRTPSGNIVCGYGVDRAYGASLECGIKSGLRPPPEPIHCRAGDPSDKRVDLRETGRSAPVLCAGDPGPFLPVVERKARVLAYGSSLRIGGIVCASEPTGLTCRNRSGHGFLLSRERWRAF